MSVLKILQYPDARLSQPGKEVTVFDDNLKKSVDNIIDTYRQSTDCAGLAATQLGIPLRIIVIGLLEENNEPLCLINPEIISKKGQQTFIEGCMSVGYVSGSVTRAETIEVRYQDREGNIHDMKASGFRATCIQHEIDHLDGKLFIEELSPLKRTLIVAFFSVMETARKYTRNGVLALIALGLSIALLTIIQPMPLGTVLCAGVVLLLLFAVYKYRSFVAYEKNMMRAVERNMLHITPISSNIKQKDTIELRGFIPNASEGAKEVTTGISNSLKGV